MIISAPTPPGRSRSATPTGILIETASAGNTIGGTAAGAGNVISGNTGDGVASGTGTTGNVVAGNLIGTNVTGRRALGNATTASRSTTAPRTTRSAARRPRPATSSPPTGCAGVDSSHANDNLVEGDFIGTDVTGDVALGNNGSRGRRRFGGRRDHHVFRLRGNTIGGLTATPGTGAGNLISGNTYAGVELYAAGPTTWWPAT